MIYGIKLYLIAFKNALAERIAYRFDFILSTFIVLLFEFTMPLVIILIYRSGSSFPGWGMYEVLLIQAIFLTIKGISFTFFFGMVWNVLERVREGTFDLLLIKPSSALFMSIVTGIDIENLGKIIGGVGLLVFVQFHLNSPSIVQWTQFIFVVIAGVSVFFSFALILSGVLFKWVGNSRVWEILDSITMFGLYPRSIFSKGLQSLITNIIPVAMIGFFPASVLLEKARTGIISSAIACLILLMFSLFFWRKMLKRYSSAGG